MKHIVTFSGGKDSLATIIWAKNNLPDFEVVFCDTGWEHPATYNHIKQIEEWIGKEFITLTNPKYPNGFIDLCIAKKRVASTKARFCTEELKVKPMIDYIIDYLLPFNNDIVIYQGVRADESLSRSMMKQKDDYFKFYFEPYKHDKKGKPVYHTYRKKEIVKAYNSKFVDVHRPILKWNAQQVFEYIFEAGLKANPLYYEGFGRVGCFPCIMSTHSEIKLIIERYPEYIDKIRLLEQTIGMSFFGKDYIPVWACSGRAIDKKGGVMVFPWIDDVVKYLQDNPNQIQMFPKHTGCISVYNICESGK
jgi:3'-phosphoadenosine 5'-phosphosulfate sulfotransferase (PAPS reductase)/FAD synthetase